MYHRVLMKIQAE